MATNLYLAVTALIGANLLFMVWLWHRARPASGEALLLPPMILLGTSMLVGVLPWVLWPESDTIHIVASITSILLTIVATVWNILQSRRLHRARRSAE